MRYAAALGFAVRKENSELFDGKRVKCSFRCQRSSVHKRENQGVVVQRASRAMRCGLPPLNMWRNKGSSKVMRVAAVINRVIIRGHVINKWSFIVIVNDDTRQRDRH